MSDGGKEKMEGINADHDTHWANNNNDLFFFVCYAAPGEEFEDFQGHIEDFIQAEEHKKLMRGRGASRVDHRLAVQGKDGTYSLIERGREVAAEVQERREAEHARLRLSKKLGIYG